MKSVLRRAAEVALSSSGYNISDAVTGTINYLIDSWHAKSDARSAAAAQGRVNLPSDLNKHLVNTFLGCSGNEQFKLTKTFPRIFRDRVAYAMHRLVAEQTPFATADFLSTYEFAAYVDGCRDYTIINAGIHTSIDQEISLPVFGSHLLTYQSIPFIVRYDLGYDSMNCDFQILCQDKYKKVAEKFAIELQASMVSNDIYYKKCLTFENGSLAFHNITPTNFSQVVLKAQLKDRIIQNTIGVLESADQLLGLGLCPSRNTLLVSPPGMAKSTMFRSLSTMLEGKATRIWCTGKSITYAEHVTQLFQAARELGPCMIFIEDMDLFGGDRSSSYDSVVLNEFLSCLDGQVENSGVVILASTNDFLSMDEALTNRPGRFDMKVEIPMPDKEDRHLLLNSFFTRYHSMPDASVTREIWNSVLEMTDGMTGAYIQELAKSCVMLATRQGGVQADSQVCVYNSSQLMASVESVLENWRMGQQAKKHHSYNKAANTAPMAGPEVALKAAEASFAYVR